MIEHLQSFAIMSRDAQFFFYVLYSYDVYTMIGSLPLPSPHSLLSPPHPLFQAGTVLPLSLILLESINISKEDQGFLLVEVRIAI
jgi:hypothetical protein